MSHDPWLPTPTDLDEAPSLAVLAILQATIRVADATLVADHPVLLDSEPPDELLDRAAAAVASHLYPLHRAILAYRAALERFRLANPL